MNISIPPSRTIKKFSLCRFGLIAALAPLLLLHVGKVAAATDNESRCGFLGNAFGPFDYRTAQANDKLIVERVHFSPQTEHLIRGSGTGALGADIDYTLRVFPNHPRALKAMMELGFREKAEKPRGANWPVWCYFDRAIRFKGDDAQAKMVYAIYLQRKGKSKEAIEQLEEADALVQDNGNIHYNLGLIYLDLGNYEKSLLHAHKAYKLGFQLEGLRNRLKRANKWSEPEPERVKPETEDELKATQQ